MPLGSNLAIGFQAEMPNIKTYWLIIADTGFDPMSRSYDEFQGRFFHFT